MKFFCIGDQDTVRGFRLAGVAGSPVATPAEAAQALAQATARPDLSILIFTQKAASMIREEVDAFRLIHDRPLVVEVPGPEGPEADRKGLRQLVQSAVGVCVGKETEAA